MIKSKQISLQYLKQCSKTYPRISKLFEKEILVQKILKDIIKFSKLDLLNLKYGYCYNVDQELVEKEIDDSTKHRIFKLEITRPLGMKIPPEGCQSDLNSSYSPHKKDDGESTEDDSCVGDDKDATFKPSSYTTSGMTSGVQDMRVNDHLYAKQVLDLVEKNRIIRGEKFEICKNFFIKWTISDQRRKELWRKRIGNKLGITRAQYNGLLLILREDGVPSKVDRVITNDLKRTFPDCKTHSEGKSMYNKMRKILRLFHIYRPEISYIQGMTYLLSPLYYYFDEFEVFVLLANMIVTNKFVWTMYTFDLKRVSLPIPPIPTPYNSHLIKNRLKHFLKFSIKSSKKLAQR